jgi:hypothetical protein
MEIPTMRRLYLVTLLFLVSPQIVPAQEEVGRKATIDFLQKLQTDSGGFLAMAKAPDIQRPPTLRATSSAMRALRYFGGAVPNKDACARFVESCFDADSGGFGDSPKGKPDIFTTALGLMAVAELKLPMDKYGPPAAKYLGTNAKSFEEIRIAAAGLEVQKDKSDKADAWLAEVTKGQNADGSFGKGLGQARDTGSRVVTLLRLGAKVEGQGTIMKVLKEGQRNNGGYGKADSELASDLETTYRVMRCFHMLKALPDNVEGIRSFVAKCRNEDGGYAVVPGEPSTVSGTYFAGIILYWLDKK